MMQWQWLNRVLLIPRLRVAMDVRAFRRSYATLYAIDCSAEECSRLATIQTSELERLGSGIQYYLDVAGVIPRIRVLCFGVSARHENAPPAIKQWTIKPFGGGVWVRELRAALALFEGGNPIRRIVIHEVAHALLDLLTDTFPYPLAIVEGFARRGEFLLPDQAGKIEWERQSTDRIRRRAGHLSDSQCMSIKELLVFDAAKHWRQNMGAFLRMTDLSFWLNVYLFKLSKQCPVTKRILSELRLKNITTPEGVYQWLQETSGMKEAVLEASFRSFCTTERLPSAGEEPVQA